MDSKKVLTTIVLIAATFITVLLVLWLGHEASVLLDNKVSYIEDGSYGTGCDEHTINVYNMFHEQLYAITGNYSQIKSDLIYLHEKMGISKIWTWSTNEESLDDYLRSLDASCPSNPVPVSNTTAHPPPLVVPTAPTPTPTYDYKGWNTKTGGNYER